MSQNFTPGDYLIFQIEAAYGLLRLLAIEEREDDTIWHLAAYEDMFLDIEMADSALKSPDSLKISMPHAALTTRAFEATQTARMLNQPLNESDLEGYEKWKRDPQGEISDRTVRLLLGLR
ncbi:MAG: hypothetical protein R2681_17125 [Pyrinomonadaceae bacterium]